jgi:hypothetical protein
VVEEDAMKLVEFISADDTTSVYVNPELVCFVRPTVDGEAGNTLIMTEGGGLFVQPRADIVVRLLGL